MTGPSPQCGTGPACFSLIVNNHAKSRLCSPKSGLSVFSGRPLFIVLELSFQLQMELAWVIVTSKSQKPPSAWTATSMSCSSGKISIAPAAI